MEIEQTGSRLGAHSRHSSARMSRSRLFLGGSVFTGARFRFIGCSQNAAQWSCRSVLGKRVQLKDVACTIIGIARPGFRGLRTGGTAAKITIPAQWHSHLTLKDNTTFALFGRLAKGVSQKKAEADLGLAYRQWALPEAKKVNDASEREALLRQTIVVSPERQGSLEFDRRFVIQLRLVEAVVALVLLIACVNLANLLLARGTSRSREIAVRLALGARRGRIIRQLLTESLLLSVCGGAVGLAISVPLMRLFALTLRGNANADALGIQMDGTVLVFAAVLSIACGILFGLVPALRSTDNRLSSSFQGQPVNSGTRLRSGRVLIVPQVALSLGVLILTGLLLRSLERLQQVDLGFDRQHLLEFWLYPTLSGYKDQRELDLYDRVLGAVRRVPGVRAASLSRLTLRHRGRRRGLAIDGAINADAPFVFNTAAPDLFETLRLPLLMGRDFESREERSLALLLAGFGALAFGLAILGLYGTVAYSVSQRMRELAIRFALGATRDGVLWMIMTDAMRYVLLGILLGCALAGAASRAVESDRTYGVWHRFR
jgi:predicted permease